MEDIYIFTLIIILVLLIIYINFNKKENLEIKPNYPYIKLYENFYQNGLIFDFEPFDDPSALYIRKIIKANIKSIDLNIIKHNDGLDDTRFIKIWNMDDGSNIASLETDFYNPYTESDFARRANPKYELIVDIKPGERLTANFTIPIKKIFLYARL